MNFICKLFGCKPNCDDAREAEQEDCAQRLDAVHKGHEAEYVKLNKVKKRWEDRAEEWRLKYQGCRDELNAKPEPSKAIKSLTIQDGKFIVNGIETELYGAFKRKAFAIGSGDYPASNVNYTYKDIEEDFLNSKANYFRAIAPLDLVYFRKKLEKYLEAGKVAQVELWDAGNPNRAYAAHWKDIFNAVKDLPVIFDAHNEFILIGGGPKADRIVNYVTSHGGLIAAGAWGSSTHGKVEADMFKIMNNKYQIVSHHRDWNEASILADKEPGKPLILSELHSRDVSLQQMKDMVTAFSKLDVQGIQVFSLDNWGSGAGSNFRNILNFMGGLVK